MSMISRSEIATLEKMCRERAGLAKKEMDYWLAEAEEWKRLEGTTQTRVEQIPMQLT